MDHEHQQQPGDLGKAVHGGVDAAGGVLALLGLLHLARDLIAQAVQGIRVLGGEEHQGLLRVIGETALGYKAQADVVALVHPPPLDEAVHLGPLPDHPGDGHDEAVHQGGFVFRVLGVLLLQPLQQLGHVDLLVDVDLRRGSAGHQVHHDGGQASHVLDPAAVVAVSVLALVRFLLCHGFLPYLYIIIIKIIFTE